MQTLADVIFVLALVLPPVTVLVAAGVALGASLVRPSRVADRPVRRRALTT
jgi:hypothetical protein